MKRNIGERQIQAIKSGSEGKKGEIKRREGGGKM